MNIQEIQKLAYEFRQATDDAVEYGALGPNFSLCFLAMKLLLTFVATTV